MALGKKKVKQIPFWVETTQLQAHTQQTVISEPDRGRQNWRGQAVERRAVYANRRRVKSQTGKQLLRRRGEYLERAGAHLYDTGGMRRVHLRGKKNIAKRALVHAAAFNLSLILRIVLGVGTARQAADRLAAVCFWFLWLVETERRDHQPPTCLT